MKRTLITIAKFAISFAILGYMISDIRQNAPDTFADVINKPKNWWCLLGGLLCYGGALAVGLVRWHLLARTVDLQLRFAQIARLGAFAYMVEVVTIGIAGGDAARAAMLARLKPKRAAAAIVSVAVDRATGGFVILWYLSVAAFFVQPQAVPVVAAIGTIQLLATISLAALITWVLAPRLAPWAIGRAERLGKIGRFAAHMIAAAESYRGRASVLGIAAIMTGGVLLLITSSFYLMASGLPGGAPTWSEHTVIVPLLLLTALVPMPVQGLGVVDYALNYLYQNVAAVPPAIGQGLVVAMATRLSSMCLCSIAAVVYALLPPANSE